MSPGFYRAFTIDCMAFTRVLPHVTPVCPGVRWINADVHKTEKNQLLAWLSHWSTFTMNLPLLPVCLFCVPIIQYRQQWNKKEKRRSFNVHISFGPALCWPMLWQTLWIGGKLGVILLLVWRVQPPAPYSTRCGFWEHTQYFQDGGEQEAGQGKSPDSVILISPVTCRDAFCLHLNSCKILLLCEDEDTRSIRVKLET